MAERKSKRLRGCVLCGCTFHYTAKEMAEHGGKCSGVVERVVQEKPAPFLAWCPKA